jgi:N-acetylneuraminate synthase
MGEAVVIIAECGINHNGDIEIAKELIRGAKWAGATAVKFQKRTIDKVYTKEYLDKPRESTWGTTNRDQKEGLEFNKEEYDIIDAYCKELDIFWSASPWDLESVEFLKQYNLSFNKVPSALLTHKELLKAIAEQGKYTYISTGMSTLEEIEGAIEVFRKYKCPFELMHCNSAYPADEVELNLLMIPRLISVYGCKVGYSGHEVGLPPSAIAVALGATSIERHITLSRTMYGSDQAASVEIDGFKKLVDMIRQTERVIGNGAKTITEKEKQCKAKLRRDKDVQ